MIIKVADQLTSVFLDNCSEVNVAKNYAALPPIIDGCFELLTHFGMAEGESIPMPPEILVNFKRLGEHGQLRTNKPCYLMSDNGKTIERLI